MSSVYSAGADCLSHNVALGRLQAHGGPEKPAPDRAGTGSDFADTVPLWFRSEAFAEDVCEHAAGAQGPAGVDQRVIHAGAEVLRRTLQAFRFQRW